MVIQVENLVKRYGDLVALDHFGLQIAEGEIFDRAGKHRLLLQPVCAG